MWLMVTGGAIWVMDNLMKGFENPMEDAFRKQARVINKSLRLNLGILIACLSAYGYVKFQLKTEIEALPELARGFVWVLSSVGKFLLHLGAYAVYFGNNLFYGGEHNYPKPEADQDVFIGFIVIVGYIFVRRVIVARTNPIVWGLLVVLLLVFATYFTGKNDSNVIDRIRNVFPNQRDTTLVDNTKTKEEEDNKIVVPDEIPDAFDNIEEKPKVKILDIFKDDINEVDNHLNSIIDKFENKNFDFQRDEKLVKDDPLYQEIMRISRILNSEDRTEYEKRKIRKSLKRLCKKYAEYFDSNNICDTPFAN